MLRNGVTDSLLPAYLGRHIQIDMLDTVEWVVGRLADVARDDCRSSSAKRFAIASPIPRVPPVTRAILSLSLIIPSKLFFISGSPLISGFWRTKVILSSLVLRLPPQHRKPHRVAPIQNALVRLMKSNGSGAAHLETHPSLAHTVYRPIPELPAARQFFLRACS